MPKQTGKGSHHKRKEAAFERSAMQHTNFIGQAEPLRAEAEQRKREHLEAERSHDTVREMAAELEQFAGLKESPKAAEVSFRIPRSIDEGKRLIREAPDALREKARERLELLPEPAQRAMELAQSAAELIFVPVRFGLGIVRELVRIPGTMLRMLRHKEA